MAKPKSKITPVQGALTGARFTLPPQFCIVAEPSVSGSAEPKQTSTSFTPSDQLFTTLGEAAKHWFLFGLVFLPIQPKQKIPATAWDPWFKKFSKTSIETYWSLYPDHEIACLVGNDMIVYDADTPLAVDALVAHEEKFGMTPLLVVKTRKGEHHYFRRAPGSVARSDSHSTEKHPERIDVKTGRNLAMLPGSTDKVIDVCSVKHASELSVASQEFMDAVCVHNGRTPPQIRLNVPHEESEQRTDCGASKAEITNLAKLVMSIDPDMGYEDWLHVLMAIFYETDGSEEGLALAIRWSSEGDSYRGIKDIETKWRSFRTDTATRYTIGTLIWMARNAGVDTDAIMQNDAEAFELCETVTIYPSGLIQHEAISSDVSTITAVPKKPIEQPGAVKNSSINSTKDDALARVQKQFGLISMNGKVGVFDRTTLEMRTEKGSAQKLALSSRPDGGLLIMRALTAGCTDPDADIKKVLAQFWVSPQTVCYAGVDFKPNGTPDNYLNLWVGPTIVSTPGSWALIKEFLLNVICDGNEAHYVYLISYIAHALQHPEEKPGILIILIGGQGNGKGTLARILQRIWTATFLQVSNVDAVVGNFNAALERAFIVFMDEALFAGDRRSSDALKSLVTEPVIHVNEKYQVARQTASYHRFFVATNADHLKDTNRDDRRDVSLRVSESRKGDHAYWKTLYEEINGGGVEAMVHDLLAMDLSSFNARAKPDTAELLEQKLQSLGPIQRWWHECLVHGGMDEDQAWPDYLATLDAVAGICDLNGGKMYRKPSTIDVANALKKLCPSATPGQKETDLGRRRGLTLPTLAIARAEFEVFIGASVTW